MKGRFLSCPLTLEDFEIWDRLSEPRFREGAPFEYGVPLNGYCEAHFRDADLMYALADMKKHMPDSKAVTHRMLDGRFGVPESILIDGFWVSLG